MLELKFGFRNLKEPPNSPRLDCGVGVNPEPMSKEELERLNGILPRKSCLKYA